LQFSALIKRLKVRNLLSVVFALSALIMLWLSDISPKGIVWAAYWPVIFLLQLLIVTIPWRAVPLKLTWQFFLLGMSIVPAVTFLAQYLLYNLLSSTPIYYFLTSDEVLGGVDLMAPVVAPLTEEIFKILPVLLFLGLGRNLAWRRITGPLDAMLLAAASGAGFDFIENLFRATNNYWAPLGPDRVSWVASPHLGSLYLYPNMIASDMYGVPTVWFGHAEMTACVGLALGLGLFIRQKFKLWWLLPLTILLWAMWDHFLVNYLGPLPEQLWARTLPALDLYGYLLPYVFLAGFLLAVYQTIRTQKWYVQQDHLAAVSTGILKYPQKLLHLPGFLRLRQMAAFGLRDFALAKPDKANNRASWVWALREQMILKKMKLG